MRNKKTHAVCKALLLTLLVATVFLALQSGGAQAQGPVVSLSPTSVTFPMQSIETKSMPQTVMLANTGTGTLSIAAITTGGPFSGDFSLTNGCPSSLAPGANCPISLVFTPAGTGTRSGSLVVIDNATGGSQSVPLSGLGAGTITDISSSAYNLLNSLVSANQNCFYVYKDVDSALNHGFPSRFGTFSAVAIDEGCVDDPVDLTIGCYPASDTTDFDGTRGTVMRVTLGPFTGVESAGVNIQDAGTYAYDLSQAAQVTFDMRSPDGAVVQFGVGGCVTSPIGPIGLTWSAQTIVLADLPDCALDLTNISILFAVQAGNPNGGTVLLDNIQFLPVPPRANQSSSGESLSFPVGTETFGVVPQTSNFASDQVDRNVASTYESALTLLALLQQPGGDMTNAQEVANAFHYAVYHDNHGDPIPTAPGNLSGCYGGTATTQCGLHDAYYGGDIGLLNSQTGGAQAGDVRLAGFGVPTVPYAFDLVNDGASGGNNAFAALALTAAYLQLGNATYLNDAVTIGTWIAANLQDQTGSGYGGYYNGYGGLYNSMAGQLDKGKSTESNADIFAAFNLLSQVESGLGNTTLAQQFATDANAAATFIKAMMIESNGGFYVGTVPAGSKAPCPGGGQTGNDVVDVCNFLDASSLTTLALAGSSEFGTTNSNAINWNRPLDNILASFGQTATAGGVNFSGFGLIAPPPAPGIAWEFTGQAVETCSYVDALYVTTDFQSCIQTYQSDILQAANSTPFGDGMGVVDSTVPNGDTLPLASQYLLTIFENIPERVDLAATIWALFSNLGINPLAPLPQVVLSETNVGFGNEPIGTASAAQTVTVTNTGSMSLSVSKVSITGANSSDFGETTTCDSSLATGADCTISVTFTPSASGSRGASLTVTDNAPDSPQAISLTGTGAAVPVAVVSATTLQFAALLVKSTSSSQTVTLSNTGGAALTVASITTSGNFAQTSNCGSSVAAGGSCTINVTVTPLSGGSLTGNLTITDNSNDTTGSTQTVSLTGTGQDFTLAAASGSSSSQTISPGQTATYTLSLGAEGGFNQSVSFSCAGAPSYSTCTVSPSSQTPGSNVTVSVATTGPSALSPRTLRPPRLPSPQALLVLAALLASIAYALRVSKQSRASWRTVFLSLAAALVLALSFAGCGGGSSSTSQTPTPPGTSTLTVTGTVGSGSTALTHSATLTLTVS
jgi:hypothetical protein